MNILYGDISKITNFHYKRVNTCLEKALLCLLSNDIPPFIDDYRSLARTEGFNTFCREIRELRNGAAGLSNQRLKEEFAAYQLNHLYKELPLLVRIAEATNICSVIQEAAASAISNIVSPERYLASPNQITGDLSRFISTALNIDQIINLRPALTLNNVESAVRVVDLSYISAVRIGGAIRIANEMYKSWAEEPNSSWVERYTEACVAAIHGDYLDAARKFGKAAMLADNADQEMYSYSFQAQYCIEANQPQTAITINKKIISQKSKLKTLSKFTLLVFNPYYAIANIYYSSFNEIYQELSQKTLDENKQNELKLLQVNLSRLVQFYANLALDEISDLDRYFKAKGRSRTLLTMTGNEISPRRQEQAAVQLPGVNHQQQPATLQEQAAVQLPGANRQQQPATLQEQAAVQLPGVNHQQQPATLQEQAAVQLPGANRQQQPATLQEQAAVQLPGASRQQQPDNPEGMLCKMKEKVMKILFSMAIIDKGIASDAPCYFVITHSSFKQDDSWCTQNEINTDYPVVTFHQKEDDFYIEHHEKCNKEPYKHSFERGMLIQDETLKDMLFKVYKESEYDKENRLWNTKKPLLLSGKQAFMCKLTAMAILGSKCFSHNYSVDRFKQKLAIESDLSLGKIPLLEIIRTDETRFISEEISLSTINNLMKHSHNTIFHDPLQKLNPNNVILEYIIDTAFCGAMLPEPNYDFYHSRGPHVERTLYFDTLMSLSDRNMFGIKPLSHRQQNSFFVMSIYRDLYKKKHIKENIIAGTAMLTRTFFSLRLECFHAIVAEQLLRKTHQYISENKFSSASLTQEKELGELCCLLYQQLGNFDKYHHDDNLSYDSQRKALQQLRREIGESHMSFFSDKISEFRFAPHKFLTDRVTFFSASSAVFGLSYVAYKSYAAYEAISKVENK